MSVVLQRIMQYLYLWSDEFHHKICHSVRNELLELSLKCFAKHHELIYLILELQAHGGPMVLDLLLSRILSLGVRAARAGEFSERAFLNDKIDLTQAEAIAAIVSKTPDVESIVEQAGATPTRAFSGQRLRRIQFFVNRYRIVGGHRADVHFYCAGEDGAQHH